MTERMKLILTRPTDDSLEAFENFRKITTLKSTQSKEGLMKDDLAVEWEKFWRSINERTDKRMCTDRSIN